MADSSLFPRTLVSLLTLLFFPLAALADDRGSSESQQQQEDHFERYVRPLLLEKCSGCHGSETQWNGLRVDSQAGLLKGGEQGPAIVPGKANESLLVAAVRRTGDSPMPPDEPLSDQQVRLLVDWVDAGAYWPNEDPNKQSSVDSYKHHWAFQPIVAPKLPENRWPEWAKNEIDLFIAEGLDAAGLTPAGTADKQTLLRRIAYDVTGLPPGFTEVDEWLQDTSNPNERLDAWIQRMLESPAYGEHWGRLWLDVARYSDTKGYVYAREEKNFIHSHVYRDWVIKAFNADLPFDRFVKLQLAADLLTEPGDPDRAAMGFLTLGRRFIGVSHDIIDDRIDVVTRGLMGLTVACARCHDHKYDPIPTTDYYALYGVFSNSTECREPLVGSSSYETDQPSEWLKGLQSREQAFDQALQNARQTASERMRAKIVEYFVAQTELSKYPQEGFDQILSTDDLIPNLVHRLDAALWRAKHVNDPRFTVWHRFREHAQKEVVETSGDQSGDESKVWSDIWNQLRSEADDVCHPITRNLFEQAPQSFREVAVAYAQMIAGDGRSVFEDFLQGPNSPFEIPNELMYGIEGLFDSGTCDSLWKLQNEVDRWILRDDAEAAYAMTLSDREGEYQAYVFRRGDPSRRGDFVDRKMIEFLADGDAPFTDGRDRLQLSEHLVARHNPLTARVWVNRIWRQYFGEGLVRTTSDFGLRAETPSHPKLLDWLALRLIEQGWSTKEIHRLILGSATYRQGSLGSQSGEVRVRALQIDPENRLLWHMAAKRLTFEAMRDSMLAASGDLNHDIGGRGGRLFPAINEMGRRTIYSSIDRQFVPDILRVFDYANPDMHAPKRSETLVPQQSLFWLNHPFVAARAQSLVASLAGENEAEKLEEMYLRVLHRKPTAEERIALTEFLANPLEEPTESVPVPAQAWSYGIAKLVVEATRDANANSAESSNADTSFEQASAATLHDFEPLPYFSGTAWQGSDRYPDSRLGWAQLSAAGGHPGNDLNHVVVRRWTAPHGMEIEIDSKLVHEESAGDGVRAWILSSRHGGLATGRAHHNRWEWTSEPLHVQAGDQIDFVVDIYEVLNTDQYLWHVRLAEREKATEAESQSSGWDSQRDFYGPAPARLNTWEQLGQVLLICNEAMYVE